jgi:hypothetical protein
MCPTVSCHCVSSCACYHIAVSMWLIKWLGVQAEHTVSLLLQGCSFLVLAITSNVKDVIKPG